MTELSFEGARQMGLVDESAPLGHLPHRKLSRRQQLDGARQAALQHESVRRHAYGVAKRAREMRTAAGGL